MSPVLPDDLIRAEVASLPSYNAGLALDRFRDVYGIDCVAKLDSNESPLGASPRAIEAIHDHAAGVARYPDAANTALREKIAALHGHSADRVIFGNGSEDLIGALFRAVLRPGDHLVTVCPSFGLHEFGALACGASVAKVAFGPDWSYPVTGLIAAMQARAPRILIFSAPSNPAGPTLSEADFRKLVAAVPDKTLIALDEAYIEYVSPSARFDALSILSGCDKPWIVLRTFSKAYGLAGMRIGYGIGSDPVLIGAAMKTRNPFGVNALAVAAATKALEDTAHLDRVVELARHERHRMIHALKRLGYPSAPSETNFVFFNTRRQATDLTEALRRRGILVKPWLEAPYSDWARVTLGSPTENDAFLSALEAI